MTRYAYGRRAKSVILVTAGLYALLGLAVLVCAGALLWIVPWPGRWVGVLVALLATWFFIEVWAHLYLLSHPPTMTAAGDTVVIRAWPMLREPLVLTRDEVRRIDWWDQPHDADDGVALLAPQPLRPNVLVRLNAPRTLPTNRLGCRLFGFARSKFGNQAEVPTRGGQYEAIGLNTASEVRQPEDWPYPVR